MPSRRNLIGASALALGAAGGAGYWFGLRPLAVPQPAEVGFALSDAELATARDFLTRHPVVDTHAHPGRTFLKGAEGLSFLLRLYRTIGGTFEEASIADMRMGGLAAAVFNGVGDVQVITLGDGGLRAYRDFSPGEAWASCQRQLDHLQALADRGLVRLCLSPDDVRSAHAAGIPGMILAMEGADFLDGDTGRIAQLQARGLRMLTLVHYRDNQIGPIITGQQANGRLSAFGAEVVAACEEAGVMIDLTHSAEPMAFDVLAAARGPVALTHAHLNTARLSNARFVSADLAQAVAASGGFVGAWPAGIGIDSLSGFADRVIELIEALGPAHVGLGTDMDANYKPVLETYAKLPLLVGELLRRGVAEGVLAQVLGGTALAMWQTCQDRAA